MIPLFYPAILREEWIKELDKLFEGKHIAQGPQVDLFEKEFGKKFGYEHCVAVNSATSALELTTHLLDIRPGDEIVGPALTCIATYLPFIRRGAKITFVDVDANLTMNVSDLKRKLTKSTKALIVVNLGGIQVNEEIFEFATGMDVPIVIDAAQSLGIAEKHGDYIIYSFQAIKHFTTGDGGMLILKDSLEYDAARKLRWFGIDREKRVESGYREMTLDILEPGYKYQMNDIAATMGLVGLRHSDEFLDYRVKIGNIYRRGIQAPQVVGGSHWLFGIIVKDRQDFFEKMKAKGIETNVIHVRIDSYSIFQREKLNFMDALEKKYVYLPFHQYLTVDQAHQVVEAVNELIV